MYLTLRIKDLQKVYAGKLKQVRFLCKNFIPEHTSVEYRWDDSGVYSINKVACFLDTELGPFKVNIPFTVYGYLSIIEKYDLVGDKRVFHVDIMKDSRECSGTAVRYLKKIDYVKLERLCSITSEDIFKEGIQVEVPMEKLIEYYKRDMKIGKKWNKNPWTWSVGVSGLYSAARTLDPSSTVKNSTA